MRGQLCHAQVRFDKWVEPFCFQRRLEFREQAAHEAEVDGADDLGMLFGGLPKWAVVKQDRAGPAGGHCFGCKADVLEDVNEVAGSSRRTHAAAGSAAFDEIVSPVLARPHRRSDSLTVVVGEVTGKNFSQQPVIAPARAGAVRTGQVQGARTPGHFAFLAGAHSETGFDECIEMKSGGVGVQLHPVGNIAHAQCRPPRLEHPEDPFPAGTECGWIDRVRVRQQIACHNLIFHSALVETSPAHLAPATCPPPQGRPARSEVSA